MKKTIFLIILATLYGCGRSTGGGRDSVHDSVLDTGHGDEIVISPGRQAALGIRTAVVSAGEFHEVIRTGGRILSSAGDESTVVAKSEGIISLNSLSVGSAVGKGARIGTISSREIGTGDKLAKARITYETAKKEYERDLQLSADNIVSETHLDQSRLEYEYAKAEYDALSAGAAASGGITVSSPISGFIKTLNVKNGDYVGTGTLIATVSRNRRLQLRADLSEKHFGELGRIRDANFTTSYSDSVFRLKDLGGRLVGCGRPSDGDFFIPVTFEFDNKGEFVPGSYVTVYLITSSAGSVISVPLSAVIEDQGVHCVFVRDADDCFVRREVVPGGSDGERIAILKGLSEGETIVTEGAVDVKLAGSVSSPAGHSHNH